MLLWCSLSKTLESCLKSFIKHCIRRFFLADLHLTFLEFDFLIQYFTAYVKWIYESYNTNFNYIKGN